MGALMEVVVKPNDDGSYLIAISGAINEYSQKQFQKVLRDIATTNIVEIDLGNVDIINSIGSMYWAELIRALCKVTTVKLINCSVNMMSCLSRMPAMLESAQIMSFQVPFRCPQCTRIFSQLLTSDQICEHEFPKITCDKCATTAVAEIDFDDYSFISQQTPG